jgi:hypothetical protein
MKVIGIVVEFRIISLIMFFKVAQSAGNLGAAGGVGVGGTPAVQNSVGDLNSLNKNGELKNSKI